MTTPALAVVWMAGFTMAFGVGWESSPWLLLKMIPVVLLSGLHSLQATALRRLLREGKMVGPLFRAAPVAILVAFASSLGSRSPNPSELPLHPYLRN